MTAAGATATRRRRRPASSPAIRLKAPRDGETVIDDLVQGTVRVANAELDDMIILRSDGTPTYHHSVVVDDHDMGITHVIRGDDHLTNTFRQVADLRRDGLGAAALRPSAADPRRRRGETVEAPRRRSSRWSSATRATCPRRCATTCCGSAGRMATSRCSTATEAIRLFDLDGVGRAPSRMDYAKLTYLNGVYIRQADDERLTARGAGAAGPPARPGAGRRRGGTHPRAGAGLEGAGKDAGGTGGFRRLPGAPPAAADRAEGRRAAHPRGAGRCCVTLAAALAATRIHAGSAGRRAARLRRAKRAQARPGGAAVACGFDRQHGQPGDRCHAGRAGPRRDAGPHRGCRVRLRAWGAPRRLAAGWDAWCRRQDRSKQGLRRLRLAIGVEN